MRPTTPALWMTAALLTALTALASGCKTQHDVNINVAPIYATIDVNLRVKVEKDLEEFFPSETDTATQ